jgi:glycerol-3-phosphate dehydrogenase
MQRNPDALSDGTYDLLVLGGGITGAGVALDAALRGFRVALIDKGDFASGTSSESSKLVHGGLRYLEQHNFGSLRLVYESLHERRRLLNNAPHLVRPLRFVIPFYRGWRVPPWKWRIGLTLYDLLAGRGNLHRSHALKLATLRDAFPGLCAKDLVGGAEYFDARMDDARVCIEVLRSASIQGACVTNYAEAVAFEMSGGAIDAVRAVDRSSGREFRIRALQVLNATGPWLDSVCRLAGDTGGPYLRPTKGVHLVAPNPGLDTAFLLLHPTDGRVLFVIPWLGQPDAEDPRVENFPVLLIGTTDTLHEGPPDEVRATPDDTAYLLAAYNHYFAPPLKPEEILSTFAGLRPLLHAQGDDPSAMSREFRLIASPSGLLSVAGGKYTTYRHMAELAVDAVAARLGKPRLCATIDFPLDGAPRVPWSEFVDQATVSISRKHMLKARLARHLVNRYGRRAADVAACLRSAPALAEPVVAGYPDLRVEFAYQRDHEMALQSDDLLMRRTRLGLIRPDLRSLSIQSLLTPREAD